MLVAVHFRGSLQVSFSFSFIVLVFRFYIYYLSILTMANILGFTILVGLVVIFGTILTISVEFDTHYCKNDECTDTTVVCEEDSVCQFYCDDYDCRNSIINGYYAQSLSLISTNVYGIEGTTIYGPYDPQNGINDANVTLECNYEHGCKNNNIYFQFSQSTRIICSDEDSCDNNNISLNYIDDFVFRCEDERRGCANMNWQLNEINLAIFFVDGGIRSNYQISNVNLLYMICGYYYYPSASNPYYGGCEQSVFKLNNVCNAVIGFTSVDEYCKNVIIEIINVDNMYVTNNAWNCICNNYDPYDYDDEGASRIHIDSSTLFNFYTGKVKTLEEIQNCTNYQAGVLTVINYNPYSRKNGSYTLNTTCADLTHLSNLTNLSIIPYNNDNSDNNNNSNDNGYDPPLGAFGGVLFTILSCILLCCGDELVSCLCKPCSKLCEKILDFFTSSNLNKKSSATEQNIWDHDMHSQIMQKFQCYTLLPLAIFQFTLLVEDFFAFYNYDTSEYSERAFGWIVIGYSFACGLINLFALHMISSDKRETFLTLFSIVWEIGQAGGFWYITGKKYIIVFAIILVVQISSVLLFVVQFTINIYVNWKLFV